MTYQPTKKNQIQRKKTAVRKQSVFPATKSKKETRVFFAIDSVVFVLAIYMWLCVGSDF